MLAEGEPPPGCVQIGEALAPSTPLCSSQKCIARWVTIAAFHAARAATGCRSAYELEQKFGPSARKEVETVTNWSVSRDRMWDRWQRGTSTIERLRRRGSLALESRLESVRAVSPLLDDVLNMGFWRYLDPHPLTTREIVAYQTKYNFGVPMNPFCHPGFVVREARFLMESLGHIESRYNTMSDIWFQMRCSSSIGSLGRYALCFLCWLAARPRLEADPIFGGIAAEIYEYTMHHYSRVAISPMDENTFQDAIDSLRWMQFDPVRYPESMRIFLGAHDLLRLTERPPKVLSRPFA